ncbi:glycosyl hydrolase [Brachybacterium sp. DNPG3]
MSSLAPRLSRRTALAATGLLTVTAASGAVGIPGSPLGLAAARADGGSGSGSGSSTISLADPAATPETASLFAALRAQRGEGILFGHQHDLTHGWSFDEPDGTASDTLAAVGDHPAVFGWDTLILDGEERPGVSGATPADNAEHLVWAFRAADAIGGINTLSAHLPNFVTGGSFYDVSGSVVPAILPGGDRHDAFVEYLEVLASAFRGATREDGTLIPVVFRPWHENNGGWFWWGAGHATPSEYVELFRFTVEHLRDACDVHNVLYSYSPGGSFGGDPEGYLRTYPGDAFVDVLGYDTYDDSSGSQAFLDGLVADLGMIADLAEERGKVSAYTEFGQSGAEDTDPTWFTDLLAAIDADERARRSVFLLTWADWGGDNRAYIPYPASDERAEHPQHADFVAFAEDPRTIFAADLADPFSLATTVAAAHAVGHLVTPTDRSRVDAKTFTVRARLTGGEVRSALVTIDGTWKLKLRLDDDGFHSGTWRINGRWKDAETASLVLDATIGRTTVRDERLVLLGPAHEMPAGWVDDFEGYAGDDVTLGAAWSLVNGAAIALSADHRSDRSDSAYGCAYSYDFSPATYAGIGKTVGEDWSATDRLALWLQGDGSTNGATLQVVADGIYFEHALALDDAAGGQQEALFADFAPAPWDTANAGKALDAARLANVTAFNLYVGQADGGPVTGTIHIDDIRATTADGI